MRFYFTWFVFCFTLGIVIILISWSTWVGFYFMIFMGSLESYLYWRWTNLFYDLHELTCYGCFCRSIWPVAPSSRRGLQQTWFFSIDKSHISNENKFCYDTSHVHQPKCNTSSFITLSSIAWYYFTFFYISTFTHLLVVPCPKNFMRPPSIINQNMRGK